MWNDDDFNDWENEWVVDDDPQFEEVIVPQIKLDLNLREDQLPAAISSQVKAMEVLDERIQRAQERVDTAMKAAADSKHKVRAFKKKKAIEELQEAVVAQSEAMSSENEAMRLLYDNQKQLANISSGLFAFGLMNMTTNRTVYQRLKAELEKASEEELNELAKEELMKIVRQLKAQEDIYNKIDHQASSIETLQKDVSSLKSTVEAIPVMKRQVDALQMARRPAPSQPAYSAPPIVKRQKNGWLVALALVSLLLSLAAIALVYLKVLI